MGIMNDGGRGPTAELQPVIIATLPVNLLQFFVSFFHSRFSLEIDSKEEFPRPN